MRKRNAVSAAALASIGFGGVATAVVDAQHHATATPSVQASGTRVGAGTRSRPRVVTLYVDDPPVTTAAAPAGVQPNGTGPPRGPMRGTASASPTGGSTSTPGTVPPPADPIRRPPGPPSTEPSHPVVSSTTTPVATTVPPVTTTTAASSVTDAGGTDNGGRDD